MKISSINHSCLAAPSQLICRLVFSFLFHQTITFFSFFPSMSKASFYFLIHLLHPNLFSTFKSNYSSFFLLLFIWPELPKWCKSQSFGWLSSERNSCWLLNKCFFSPLFIYSHGKFAVEVIMNLIYRHFLCFSFCFAFFSSRCFVPGFRKVGGAV